MCVLCLYGRRGSFIGVWAHSPALGDSQDLSEASILAAKGGSLQRVSHQLIFTAACWKKRRAEIGQMWKGWDATTVFSKSSTAKGSPHADVRAFPSALSVQESQRQNSQMASGPRRARHSRVPLLTSSPILDSCKKEVPGVWLLQFSELAHNPCNDPPKSCHVPQALLWVLRVFQLPGAWQHCQIFSVFVWIEAVWIL